MREPFATDLLHAAAWHAGAATALAVAVFVVTRFWRNPHAGRLLWGAAVLKLLCPPLLAVAVVFPAGAAPPETSGSLLSPADTVPPTNRRLEGVSPSTPDIPPTPPILAPPSAVAPVPAAPPIIRDGEAALPHGRGSWGVPAAAAILLIWAAGTGLIWCLALVRAVRFGRGVRRLPDAGAGLQEHLEAAAAATGIEPPRLKIGPAGVGPLAWVRPVRRRADRPAVVVPAGLLDGLPGDAAESLLLHECAHLARRDEWWRCAELLACGLWWWLPTAWLAAAAGRRCEELCCDAAVLRARRECPDPAGPYAAALLAAAEHLHANRHSPVPVPASGAGRPGFLQRRFTMLCEDRVPARPGRRVRWPLAAACLALIAAGVTAGQPPADDPPTAAPPAGAAPTASGEKNAATADAVVGEEPTAAAAGTPLEDAVAAFNAASGDKLTRSGRPPLSAEEVVLTLREHTYAPGSPGEERFDREGRHARARRVVETRTLPPGAEFSTSSWANDPAPKSYGVSLSLPDPDGGSASWGIRDGERSDEVVPWSPPVYGGLRELVAPGLGGTTLAAAVADFNTVLSGLGLGERPLDLPEAKAALRAGEPNLSKRGRRLSAALNGGTLPAGAKLHLNQNRSADGTERQIVLTVPNAARGSLHPYVLRRTPLATPDGAEPGTTAAPAGPTLAEAVAAFNTEFVGTGRLKVPRRLTEGELRAALARDITAAETEYAARLAEDADYREVVSIIRGTLSAGRLTAGGRVVTRGRADAPDGGPAVIWLQQPWEDGVVSTRVRGGLSGEVRDQIAATLDAAAADESLPLSTRLKLLRESTERGGAVGGAGAGVV